MYVMSGRVRVRLSGSRQGVGRYLLSRPLGPSEKEMGVPLTWHKNRPTPEFNPSEVPSDRTPEVLGKIGPR